MGLPAEEVIARGNRALAQLGIAHLRDRAPYRLSGGEKKKGLHRLGPFLGTADPAL